MRKYVQVGLPVQEKYLEKFKVLFELSQEVGLNCLSDYCGITDIRNTAKDAARPSLRVQMYLPIEKLQRNSVPRALQSLKHRRS